MRRTAIAIAFLAAACHSPERPGPTIVLKIDGRIQSPLRSMVRDGPLPWRSIGYGVHPYDETSYPDNVVTWSVVEQDLNGNWGGAIKDQRLILIDFSAIPENDYEWAVPFTIAHEVGHMLGLPHLPPGVDGVMLDGSGDGRPSLWLTQADHDLACKHLGRCQRY